MNRKNTIVCALIGTGLALAAASVPAMAAPAQFGGPPPPVYAAPPMDGRPGFGEPRRDVLAWSHADSRPRVPQGRATGLFIWHDRNTVHVETTDNHWFGDNFEGTIEIRGGKFDNIKSERDRADTRYRQIAPNRLMFRFSAQDGDVGAFKFNIHGGNRLIFHVGQNGQRTGRIYYGESKTPSFQDPVMFNLNR